MSGAVDHDTYSDDYIRAILRDHTSFAMVGASANKVRPSFFVLKYLLAKGYSVVPVNPGLAGETLLGQVVAASLHECSAPIEIVDIFRSSQAAAGIVAQAIAERERLGIKIVWMQLGVRNDEAAREAEAAGLKVVMNRCPKIEYGRLSGEIGWAGVNSRTISNTRGRLASRGVQSRLLRED